MTTKKLQAKYTRMSTKAILARAFKGGLSIKEAKVLAATVARRIPG